MGTISKGDLKFNVYGFNLKWMTNEKNTHFVDKSTDWNS